MILVTVGTQLPFERLIRAMDALAPTLGTPIFAQTGRSPWVPVNMEWKAALDPSEFDALMQAASVVVSHAGTGTILLAQKLLKPIVIMPRLAALKEHRNDHQLATARQMKGRPGIEVAEAVGDLPDALQRAMTTFFSLVFHPERERLKAAIRRFIA